MKKGYIILLCAFLLSGCVEIRHEVYATGGVEDDAIQTQKEAYTLPDGTAVSLWEPEEESHEHSYRLQDGQELLEAKLPDAIDQVMVQGLKGAEGMEPEALKEALAYYETQGPKLEIPALLEAAYADYTQCMEEGRKFLPHVASQETEPCVETERFTGFVTTTETAAGAESEETSQVALFDRSTGELIPPEDLFTVSKEEAVQLLAERCKEQLPSVDVDRMKQLISADRVQWMQEWVRIRFEKGELPKPDTDTGEQQPGMDVDTGFEFHIAYDEIKEALQPWAVPDAS